VDAPILTTTMRMMMMMMMMMMMEAARWKLLFNENFEWLSRV